MFKEKNIIIVSIIVILAIGFIAYGFIKNPPPKDEELTNGLIENPPGVDSTNPSSAPSTQAPLDNFSKGVPVPEMDSKNVPTNIAKPEYVGPSSPGSDSDLRTFQIEIKNNKFTPDTVIVKTGDITKLSFNAIDRSYDVALPDFGLKQSISKGETKIISFQASASGQFKFFCVFCGGPSKGPVGTLIIK